MKIGLKRQRARVTRSGGKLSGVSRASSGRPSSRTATARSASSQSAGREHASATNTRAPERLSAKELDELFDSGSDDIDKYLDWEHARRPGREVQRVNVDFPLDMLREIDGEAKRMGVTRQSFIKLRLADALARRGEEIAALREAINALEREYRQFTHEFRASAS